jgi:hypothetical protein
MSTKVTWDRGIENRYGNREYRSKCGRFLIERREYDMPIRSIGYYLFVDGKKQRTQWDKLAEAKEEAQEIVDEADAQAEGAL